MAFWKLKRKRRVARAAAMRRAQFQEKGVVVGRGSEPGWRRRWRAKAVAARRASSTARMERGEAAPVQMRAKVVMEVMPRAKGTARAVRQSQRRGGARVAGAGMAASAAAPPRARAERRGQASIMGWSLCGRG
ncbi:MAG TPA: hypothetical protein DCY80_02840 [Solibacterales bacterium]|nr:hypothetical protein [Bryobacterales bacterium]